MSWWGYREMPQVRLYDNLQPNQIAPFSTTTVAVVSVRATAPAYGRSNGLVVTDTCGRCHAQIDYYKTREHAAWHDEVYAQAEELERLKEELKDLTRMVVRRTG